MHSIWYKFCQLTFTWLEKDLRQQSFHFGNCVYFIPSRALTRDVWIWFIITSLVICLFVGIFYYTYIHYNGGKTLIRMDQPLTDLFMPLMMMFHAPRVRWFRRQARTSGGSLLLATWMVGCFFFYWLYHSNLEANLAIIEYEKPIDRYEGSTYFFA